MVMNLHPPAVPKSKIPNHILVRDLPREDQLLFEAPQNVGTPGQLRPDDLERCQPIELMIPDLIDRARRLRFRSARPAQYRAQAARWDLVGRLSGSAPTIQLSRRWSLPD
ncbi:MAG: hypothetical protein DMG57_04730 [Acidobacteria bacterium]|nr:MAG: hypothetical protein DMG57_04730 [Acidobacteriota bacterium]